MDMEETLRLVRHRMDFGQQATNIAAELDIPLRHLGIICSLLDILDLPIPTSDGSSLPAVHGEIG